MENVDMCRTLKKTPKKTKHPQQKPLLLDKESDKCGGVCVLEGG